MGAPIGISFGVSRWEKYEPALFTQFGGCRQATGSMKHHAEDVRKFMDQEPSFQVAKFVFECMEVG